MAIALTNESSLCLPALQPVWHHKAPRRLVEKCPADDIYGGWKAWQDHLCSRKKPEPPRSPVARSKSPLLWGWPHELDHNSVQESIESPATLAESLIGNDSTVAPDLPLALQIVALAYAMPELSRELPAEAWWPLLERLHEVATQAQTKRVDWPADPRDVLRHQLLAGELPFVLAHLFPEVRVMRALRNCARESLSEAIVTLTDGRGTPDARLLPVFGPLFASWTRLRSLGSQSKRRPWSREAEQQFRWLVRRAIRLAGRNGRFMLTMPDYGERNRLQLTERAWDEELFATALDLAGHKRDRAAAAAALPRVVARARTKRDTANAPNPTLNSEWAGITIMAAGWSQSDARLAVAYAEKPMMIELSVAGEPLLLGAWTIDTTCDGRPVQPAGDWEEFCWENRKRFDLLELGMDLTEGLRLERQLLFARDDRVLYLADAIISRDRSAQTIRHSFSLPLARGATWQPEADTRDGLIVQQRTRSAVLPLALREWRCDPRGGSLDEQNQRLVLTQESHGAALCCPLVIDLDSKRSKRERTWRQLTVGEELEAVPRDVAVGFRAQSGRDQWLFYRSLGPAGNRSVLGQNFAGEFCAGRFLTTGELQEWVEVESC